MRLVSGVGINDADYQVSGKINGVYWRCKFYQAWKGMIDRCYNTNSKIRRPSYENCTVADEWHHFTVFKEWMEKQDWQGKHLDKDLICAGNKVYGPETCVFISHHVNSFVVSSVSKKNPELPPNITILPSGTYRAGGTDKNGKGIHLGSSKSLDIAIEMVKTHKIKMAILLAESESDENVRNLIYKRYTLGDKFETS